MKPKTTLPILLLAIFCGVPGAPAKPSANDVAKAGTLAAQIKTPAVRAALQCRVAFAETTAAVPVKDRADSKGAGLFWANYLKRLRGIDVSGCPDGFRAVFDKHLRAVGSVSDSLNHPSTRMTPDPPKIVHTAGKGGHGVPDLSFTSGNIKGHHDSLGDCGETYQAVFAAANRSMKAAPAGDGQLAGQIDGLLKD